MVKSGCFSIACIPTVKEQHHMDRNDGLAGEESFSRIKDKAFFKV
jgi:hypothetical protein